MQMKKILLFWSLVIIPLLSFSREQSSIIGRPYKCFDTSAFCSYSNFHPSQYLTDNNWDILCAFLKPGNISKLDSLGISHNSSQLRLLEVGDLLSYNNGVYSTVMKIFDKTETDAIRNQSKQFADSIFPVIEPDIKKLFLNFQKPGIPDRCIVLFSPIFSILISGTMNVWHPRSAARIMEPGLVHIGLCLITANTTKSVLTDMVLLTRIGRITSVIGSIQIN